MGVPYEVTFQEMWPTDEVMANVGQRLEGLQAARGDIDRCQVVIERPRHRKGKGRRFRVVVLVERDGGLAAHEASSEHARLTPALARAFHQIEARMGALPRGGLRTAA